MSRVLADNLATLYAEAAREYGERPAFGYPTGGGNFETVSFSGLYETGLNLATALIELGVQERDHVAIIADNRIEWIITDYGVILAGAADVPRATDISRNELRYIISHSGSRVVFVENLAMLEKVQANRTSYPEVKHVVLMEGKQAAPEGVHHLRTLIGRGAELRAAGDRRAEERIRGIRPEHCFTLIYTSGTTGLPKGVELSHANMISQIRNVPVFIDRDDVALSILPIWHSYERVFEMVMIAHGGVTYYTSVRRIADDLKAVRPTLMASAPRLWESLYQRILGRVRSASRFRQFLFSAALWSSRKVQRGRFYLRREEIDLDGHCRNPLRLARRVGGLVVGFLPWLILDRMVLRKLREVVGGRLRATVSGGGALPQYVDEFFNYIGIPVLEGYGMTETCPVLAVRTGELKVIGTVGPPLPETDIRIVDLNDGSLIYPNPSLPGQGRGRAGELHVKGPQVMRGYYKNPKATEEVLHDGWMNTGDIAIYTYNDCLKIVGRSKETIVLLNGENVQPNAIEARICESPLIDQCMLVGQDERHLGVLLVVNEDALRAEGVEFASVGELAHNRRAHEVLQRDINSLVSRDNGFKAYETVHAWRILPRPFEVGRELTHTFKIKRHVVAEEYAAVIDDLFHHSREKARSGGNEGTGRGHWA